jgi:hypothetical protein
LRGQGRQEDPLLCRSDHDRRQAYGRLQDTDKPNIEAITKAVSDYANVNALEEGSAAGSEKLGSMITSAKSVLVTAKQLTRGIRDKVPYTSGQKMMMSPGSAWMVEGSRARLLWDYNQLIEAYNRGIRI